MPTKTIHIKTDVHKKLKQIALDKGINLTELINNMLEKAVEDDS